MTYRKKITKKTGPGSRRTTTLSSTHGRTESFSNKPSKNATRRTVSFNNKTGKNRTTYTTPMGGGWSKTTSKTTGGRQRNTGSSSGSSGSFTFTGFFILLLLGVLLVLWPASVPYVIGTIIVLGVLVLVINFLIAILPWIILTGILYGLYKLYKLYEVF